MAIHVRKANKQKKLTKEQKKIVHAKPESNAGVGWAWRRGTDPRAYEEGKTNG